MRSLLMDPTTWPPPTARCLTAPVNDAAQVVTACPLVRLGSLDSLAGHAIGVGQNTFLFVNVKSTMNLQLVERRGGELVTATSTSVLWKSRSGSGNSMSRFTPRGCHRPGKLVSARQVD